MVEKKNIDQIFERLRDYQKDPPVFIWNEIENDLIRKKERFSLMTAFAAAAAVIIIVLSGWWMTANRSDQQVSRKNTSTQFQISNRNKTDLQTFSPEKANPSAVGAAEFVNPSSVNKTKIKFYILNLCVSWINR